MSIFDIVNKHPLKNQTSARLVFVDGDLNLELSNIEALGSELVVTNGMSLRLAEKVHIEKPIHCLFFVSENFNPIQTLKFNYQLVLEKTSSCQFFIEYICAAKQNYTLEIESQISIGSGSVLNLFVLQGRSTKSKLNARYRVCQSAESRFFLNSLDCGAFSSKNSFNILLDGRNASFEGRGLGLLHGVQNSVFDLTVEHVAGETASNVLYKNIIDDNAHSYFHGKIKIAPDAQKSSAHLKNHNLLLSDTACIDTLPELEVYADDVKCSHGATSGRLDEEALFYLCSRGISKSESEKLLLRAFAEEVFAVDNPLIKKYLNLFL